MPLSRANHQPAAPSITQPATSAARNAPSDWFIALILALGALAPLLPAQAPQEPPADLVRRVARREAETQAERDHYTYRQTVTVEELDDRGVIRGDYREVRDVVFSPAQERTEQLVGRPEQRLKRLQLTEEDFRDIREIQPLVLTPDRLFLYETRFRGDEKMDGADCWVLHVRPRQILQGQRLFDGLLWVDKQTLDIVRLEGQAVPQIRTTKSENLFPRFTTIRKPVNGRWFAVYTYADDTLQFRTGPQRIRLKIRYSDYKRFGAESVVTFDKQVKE
jgi:hypothetical protein